MRKCVSLLILISLLCGVLFGVPTSAEEAGKIFSTDIKACINGVWVESYNIGGKTVVIVEDVTKQYRYYDDLRTLVIDGFAPEFLVSGENPESKTPGEIIGNIYETDIKTYFRGKELTSYSLDGKMAVIIEELGEDNTFSEIGGRYVWNESLRTISLESMYRYPYSMRTMMEEKGYNIVLTESDNFLTAEAVVAPLTGGQILCEKEIPADSIIKVIYNDEIIGYRCSFSELAVDNNGVSERQTPVDYFYIDKVEDILFQAGDVTPTVDDWLNYFNNHTLSTVKDTFETDEYLFLYMFSSYVMKGSDRLIKINKSDGSKIEYQNLLDSEKYKRFTDVTIDKVNEKVYFGYGKNYVIDLKTDEMRLYEKLETDIGTGSADGNPSEYNSKCARNAQREYKLTADGEEKTVNGFSIPEFYYATMLPLDDTFDFLDIKYSFENDILTIDASQAKRFALEETEIITDVLGENEINYLYVEKVVLNGEETEITYPYISGHFDMTHYGRAKAKPYVCNGKVYINASFFEMLYAQDTEK